MLTYLRTRILNRLVRRTIFYTELCVLPSFLWYFVALEMKKTKNNNAFNAYGVAVMLGLSATSTTIHNAAIKEMLKMGK